jgi:LysR family transcriptional regulator for metE and metH
MAIAPARLCEHGVAKQLVLGVREADVEIDYLHAFVAKARAASTEG